jgi:hypothetical protein
MTFYHGTRRGFTRGGYLMPRTFTGKSDSTTAPLKPGKSTASDSDRYVYITTSKILAWVYAWHAPGRGKPKVLTVEVLGAVERDPEHSLDMEAYRTDMAKVINVDTEPIITEEEAREGWVQNA